MKEIKLGLLMTIGALFAASSSQGQEVPNVSKKDSNIIVKSTPVKPVVKQIESSILRVNLTVENIVIEPIFSSSSMDQSNGSLITKKTAQSLNASDITPQLAASKIPLEKSNSPLSIRVDPQYFAPNIILESTIEKENSTLTSIEKSIDYSTGIINSPRLQILSTTSPSSFNNLVIFGDSLSDNGNLYRIKKYEALGRAPFFGGRATNGLLWTENLVNSLNLKETSKNLAVGGANSKQMTEQVNLSLNEMPNVQSSDLYTLWVGTNDYYSGKSTEWTINNIRNSLNTLTAAGARKLIVVNLMDLGNLPVSKNVTIPASNLSQISLEHNQLLHRELKSIATQQTNIFIIPLDASALFNELFTDPIRFGFKKDAKSCFVTCTNPNEYILLDDIHPTEAAHRILSDYTLSILNAPKTIAHQVDLVSGILKQQYKAIDAQLDLQRWNTNSRSDSEENSKFTVFTSGEFSFGSQSDIYTRSGDSRFNSTAMTVGIIRKIGPDFRFGAAFNQAKSTISPEKNNQTIVDSHSLSLYAQKRFDRLFVNGILNYGWNNFEISRMLNVTGFDTATAQTVGNQFSTHIKIGYDLGDPGLSGLKITPTIGFGYQNIVIRDYDEANGNILNLKVKGQNFSSTMLTLGGQLSYDIQLRKAIISPYFNINYEHSLTDGSREITTELLTQAGIPMRTQTRKIDPNIVRLGLGVRGQIKDSFFVVLGYETVFGGNSSNSHAIQGQFQYRF